jgi:hypothetical protein
LNRSSYCFNNRNENYDDDYLNYQLDDDFANNYADARVTINPLLKKNIISITFFSIINNTNAILKHVHILIDIYYKNSCQKRFIVGANHFSKNINDIVIMHILNIIRLKFTLYILYIFKFNYYIHTHTHIEIYVFSYMRAYIYLQSYKHLVYLIFYNFVIIII